MTTTETSTSIDQSVTFFEAWKTKLGKDERGYPSWPTHGAAGDLASILEWVGEGFYPTALYQVKVTRDADGTFARETSSVTFPFHSDDWENDDLYACAVSEIEQMGESIESWLVKMNELRVRYTTGGLS